jgi:protein-S-isoprenylcysteine O-methyltransferase Ste14
MSHNSTIESSGVRVFPPALYAVGIGLAFLLHWYWPVRPLPTGGDLVPFERVVGWVLITVCLLLAIWPVCLFRRAGTTPNPTRPYRFTRNPMYLGLALLQVGLAMVTNALWPLLTLPLVMVAVRRLVIDREERYLETKFGEEYRAYKARVRRWL